MASWMMEFLAEFPAVSERMTGRRQDLDCVEALLADARRSREVTSEALSTIESGEYWNYPTWWPLFSHSFGDPIRLPDDFTNLCDRKRAVDALYDRLHHIEVVSVVLRFVCPEDFGIISPPVSQLLNLPPLGDHVSYYVHYLEILRVLRDHSGLARVADVDMALWSAAHSQRELPAIAELMFRDEHFQEIRLKNVFAGLRVIHDVSAGSPTEHRQVVEHLLIARALLTYDYVLAALICGRSYESLINIISAKWNIAKGTLRVGESAFLHQLKKISHQPEFSELGYSYEDLRRWWDRRVKAVHPEHKITKKEAGQFVEQVSEFGNRLLAGRDG
jgi:hypothetical protein